MDFYSSLWRLENELWGRCGTGRTIRENFRFSADDVCGLKSVYAPCNLYINKVRLFNPLLWLKMRSTPENQAFGLFPGADF